MKPPTRLVLALALGAALVAVPACRPSHGNTKPTPTGSSSPSPDASTDPGPVDPGPAPARFATLPAAAALPSEAQCTAWARSKPYPENKPGNAEENKTVGTPVDAEKVFAGADPKAIDEFGPRITGNFTGTTGEIIRWAACKWGIDEDLLMAHAAAESAWRMSALGDFTADATSCSPTHKIGADGTAGQCPDSIGLMQVRYSVYGAAFPAVEKSTAMNADLVGGLWRACYDGTLGWLNRVERGRAYVAGDDWGCVGYVMDGRWYQKRGTDYIAATKTLFASRTWEKPEFADKQAK